jgi:hypothetical protein
LAGAAERAHFAFMSSEFVPGRRAVLIGGAALAGAAIAASQQGGADAREIAGGPWAIELFTSQGCSSCPPADALLGRFARRADLVPLSFHVDYWDYIGWKDPFASRETTQRQHAYARALKQRYVYTPEMVVDGIGHEPGVNRGPIDALLLEAQRRSPRRATPELTRAADGTLTIKLAPFKLEGPADVTLVVYDRRHSTPVSAGENSGHMLDNFNIVRHFEAVSGWTGAAASWTVPADRVKPGQGLAVLVQVADCGPMLGCNKLEPMVTG